MMNFRVASAKAFEIEDGGEQEFVFYADKLLFEAELSLDVKKKVRRRDGALAKPTLLFGLTVDEETEGLTEDQDQSEQTSVAIPTIAKWTMTVPAPALNMGPGQGRARQ